MQGKQLVADKHGTLETKLLQYATQPWKGGGGGGESSKINTK